MPMFNVVCNFCARGNPEGSKFCNACGSPLNLTLCSRCEAINNVSAKQCHQCGASLSPTETEETAIPPAGLTEIGQDDERVIAKDDPLPVALEKRLDSLLDARLAPDAPQATTAEEPTLLAASPMADAPGHTDDRPLNPAHGGHAPYAGRNPARTHGFLLVAVLVALGGAGYLAFVNPTHPPSPRTMTGEGSTSVPESPSSTVPAQAEPAENPKQSPAEDPLPTSGPLPPSAESFDSPATTAESIQEATHTGKAESSGGETAPIANTRANSLPRRTASQGRTKDQAERDAIATQRLITRELTDSP
jgi:hypothetical protein